MRRFLFACLAAATALVVPPRLADAQAWPEPAHSGGVTVVVQGIDHVGRMTNEGLRKPVGKAVNFGVDLEVDYAFTDRWSISAHLPYIFSKYTDSQGPPWGLTFEPIDSCNCLTHAFADFGVTTNYNIVNIDDAFVLTPFLSAGAPSHDYPYAGEAVVGRRLPELRLGAYAGQRLDRFLPGLAVQAGYGYSMVRRALDDVPNNRSNGSALVNMAFRQGLSIRGIAAWQRTHGGLRFPCEVTDPPEIPAPSDPPFPSCEVDGPIPDERATEFHRTLRDNYLHLGAGATYPLGSWDVSAEVLWTARGSNSHDIHVLSITIGHSFELGRR